MEPVAWLKSKLVGESADNFDPLDPAHYSDQEVREDRLRLLQETKQLEKEIAEVERERKEVIQDAVGANKWKKQRLALRGDTLLKQARLKQQTYKAKQTYLAFVTVVGELRTMLQEMTNEVNKSTIEQKLASGELDPVEVGARLQEELLQLGVDVDVMQEAIEQLDFDIVLPELDQSIKHGPTSEVISEMEEGQLDTGELDSRLKEQHREEDEDLDTAGPDLDIPQPEITEGDVVDPDGR